MPLSIPELIARNAVRDHGEAGRRWLAELPGVVERLCEAWCLQVAATFSGGYVALVLAVTCADGSEAVLKLSILDEETGGEASALRHWDGRGAVRLLRADAAHGALLLERLRPGRSLFDEAGPEEACAIACALLRRLRRPAPAEHDMPLVTALAARWAAKLPAEQAALSRPLDDRLVASARALADELSSPPPAPVVVNRDMHRGNVLRAEREPWLLIDPKAYVGDPAFDTGHLLRDLLPAAPSARETTALVARLADELALEPRRVRAWAFLHSVENALWSVRAGEPFARDLLLAEQLAPR